PVPRKGARRDSAVAAAQRVRGGRSNAPLSDQVTDACKGAPLDVRSKSKGSCEPDEAALRINESSNRTAALRARCAAQPDERLLAAVPRGLGSNRHRRDSRRG